MKNVLIFLFILILAPFPANAQFPDNENDIRWSLYKNGPVKDKRGRSGVYLPTAFISDAGLTFQSCISMSLPYAIVEEMENDFRMFAEEQKHPQVYTSDDTEKTRRTEKRLTIKRTKTLEEEREKIEEGSYTEKSVALRKTFRYHPEKNCNYTCNITVNWKYSLKGVYYAKLSFSNVSPSDGSCSGEIVPSFSTNGGFNFTASGDIRLSTPMYNYDFTCDVNYHTNGPKSIYVYSSFKR